MELFLEISLILFIAMVISFIAKVLKQPLIIGYIITGLITGPYLFDILKSSESFRLFSEIGIALLLFIVGLSLKPTVIREVGKIATITGLGQVIFTVTIGFLISLLVGFNLTESLYIAIALTFSSTIIILKLLSDKGALGKLYGKISIGFLIVQDIVATIILILVSAFAMGSTVAEVAFEVTWKGLAVTLFLYIFSKYFLLKQINSIVKSQEFLFLFSLCWGLGVAALFAFLGFSMEIGALIAGVILSLTAYSYEIASKMKPLRDFFLVIFFILLGSELLVSSLGSIIVPAVIFSLFVLIGNPLIVMIIMKYLGYHRKIGFMSGLTVAQISEFSLILVALGVRVGHVGQEILSLVTLVGLITIAGSSYMIIFSDKVYFYLSKYLKVFEKPNAVKDQKPGENYDVVLFGFNRVGYDFVNSFLSQEIKFLVVDYDPAVIKFLESKKIDCIFGDVGSEDFLEDLPLASIKAFVSTIPEVDVNNFLLERTKHVAPDCLKILVSHNNKDTLVFYGNGADYVINPHILGGRYSALMFKNYLYDKKRYKKEAVDHIDRIKLRNEIDIFKENSYK